MHHIHTLNIPYFIKHISHDFKDKNEKVVNVPKPHDTNINS